MFSGSVGHCVKSHQTNSDTTLSLNKDILMVGDYSIGYCRRLVPKKTKLSYNEG